MFRLTAPCQSKPLLDSSALVDVIRSCETGLSSGVSPVHPSVVLRNRILISNPVLGPHVPPEEESRPHFG